MKNLHRMFHPASIALVGASNDEDKAGYHMLDSLKQFAGDLYPVNRRNDTIQGLKAYPNLKSIGSPVDLVALCIPAEFCLDAIHEAGEIGVGAVLITGGGFEEAGAEGEALQDEILAACRQYGIRLLGPNTVGFVNLGIELTASFNPIVKNLKSGPIGVVSQSGAMNVILCTVIQTQNLGVSIGVGTGNASDVGIPDVIEYLADHEPTKAIVVYLEGVEDGRRLYDTVRKVTPKKPVLFFTVGRGDIGDFAKSHTGKMIGSYELKKAALTQAGGVVTASSNDLIDSVKLLSKIRLKPMENPGVGLLTGQAGPGMIMADYLRRRDVKMPELGRETIKRISEVLPIKTFIRNPVDTARPMQESFLQVLSTMADDKKLDVLITYAMHEPMCVEPISLMDAIKKHTDKPVVFGTSGLPGDITPTIHNLEAMDVPAFVTPDRTAAAVWALVEDAKAAYRLQRTRRTAEIGTTDSITIKSNPDEYEAKRVIETAGLSVPDRCLCPDHASAKAAFEKLTKPCVVKISSPLIGHKTEVGGVHLNIRTEDELKEALRRIDLIEVAGERQYLIEETAPKGLEVIIGGKNDASFGPAVMLGLGGTVAEAYGDNTMRLAPLSHEDAMDMIAELKTSGLFNAWRGGPCCDKEAVADALVRIGALIYHHTEIKEIDLNPVRVYEEGILVLDAFIVCQEA